jgi:S-adenosylmethionine hydrolase
MKDEPILPTIHLNGTPKTTLLHDYYQIAISIEKLTEKISASTFHGRDYYPQDEDPIKDALMDTNAFAMAHNQRNLHLQNIHDFGVYIANHINHILEQG